MHAMVPGQGFRDRKVRSAIRDRDFPMPSAHRRLVLPIATSLALAFSLGPVAGLVASPARAEVVTGAASAPELQRVETYLNGLRTLRAQFLQVAPDGATSRGTFLLSRPGRMRIQFDPPVDNFIVADGTFVYFWDAEMKEQSNAPIGSTLADFLLRPDIRLSGDITVAGVTREAGILEVTVTQTKDPGLGRLTLVFEDKPFQLRKWRVVDAQGLTTEVALSAVETGIPLPDAPFFFRDPTRTKERD